MITFDNVSFAYKVAEDEVQAICNLSLALPAGEHVAVIGHNGSGKSTFARLCNALELPDAGYVYVNSLSARSMEDVYEIRRLCALVFQNPDDQIIGSSVEEDVAFGPENLGLPSPEIRDLVDQSLRQVGLLEEAKRSPHHLSGGQKQKLSIAGVLSMRPRYMILDEATSMLDPSTASELMNFLIELCKSEHITLINITHNMEEALLADTIFVLSHGSLLLQGTPGEVFAHRDLLQRESLSLPFHLRLWQKLEPYLSAPTLSPVPTVDDLACALAQNLCGLDSEIASPKCEPVHECSKVLLEVKDASYTYHSGSAHACQALCNINLQIYEAEILVLCGHSGSGKSTLSYLLNGLHKPQTGEVKVNGLSTAEKKHIPAIRRSVGLVFQYPERQLFATTVGEDIAFGPRQIGMTEEEIETSIAEACRILRLDEDLLGRSPFELSGGQQRRVAIAGVLAMRPDILVLDEPGAGLDPAAREEMLQEILELRAMSKTIVMITHNMDDAAQIADRIAVMSAGQILRTAAPEDIFADVELLRKSGLRLPQSLAFAKKLQRLTGTDYAFLSLEEASAQLTNLLQAQSRQGRDKHV